MSNRFGNPFQPYQLAKLTVDFDSRTVFVEGLSDLGRTQIDLRELALSELDDDEILAHLFDSGDLKAIQEFRREHLGQFV